MCDGTLWILRGKSLVVDEDVNVSDTRSDWHKNLLLFRVHVEVGSSTLMSDRDYPSLQL